MLRRIKSWPWRRISPVLALVFVVFSAITARLFVWPATGMPAHVDAIVILGGQGNRLGLGEQLAKQGRSHVLVVSEGLPFTLPPGLCGQHTAAETVICFAPDPWTTQGEAEYTARLAKQYGWHSLVLVTTPDQIWRAELRFRRCFSGKLYGVTTPLPAIWWPYAIPYQWLATAKAELVNTSC